MPRTASLDPTTRKPVLSPCTFPDGSPAWLHPWAAEAGPSINDTAYVAQFPLPAEQYGPAQLHRLDGDGLLQQAQLADSNTHAWGNMTQSKYSKWMLTVRLGVPDYATGCSQKRDCCQDPCAHTAAVIASMRCSMRLLGVVDAKTVIVLSDAHPAAAAAAVPAGC